MQAISRTSTEGSQFAVSQLRSFLAKFEHEGLDQMLPQVLKPNSAGKELDDFVYWVKYATIMRTLMVLKGSAIGPLVWNNLDSAHEHVRAVCATIAAIRWPERLLQTSQGLFSDEEYAGLMAAVAIQHPELASTAQGQTTPSRFEDAKTRIAKLGAAGISGYAGTLQMFWK